MVDRLKIRNHDFHFAKAAVFGVREITRLSPSVRKLCLRFGAFRFGATTAIMGRSMSPALAPIVTWSKRHQLLQEFAQVVSEYHRMQTAQVAAFVDGRDFPFEDWIAKAAARMEEAKYAVLAHKQEHGC